MYASGIGWARGMSIPPSCPFSCHLCMRLLSNASKRSTWCICSAPNGLSQTPDAPDTPRVHDEEASDEGPHLGPPSFPCAPGTPTDPPRGGPGEHTSLTFGTASKRHVRFSSRSYKRIQSMFGRKTGRTPEVIYRDIEIRDQSKHRNVVQRV